MNNPVMVNRLDLLHILETNRNNHLEEFQEADRGFREKATEQMEKNLSAARNGKPIVLNIRLTEPRSHVQEYDSAIGLLRMSKEDKVSLDVEDYQQYVLDQWHWTETFKSISSTYIKHG